MIQWDDKQETFSTLVDLISYIFQEWDYHSLYTTFHPCVYCNRLISSRI